LTLAGGGAENPPSHADDRTLPAPITKEEMRPPRILVAEDEAPLLEILIEGLRDEGFEVVGAEDGAQALELYRTSGPFDLLLLDEEMPRLTGRRVLSVLRADGDHVPAVLLSGNLDLSAEEQARLGVGPPLRKPISLDELARAIRRGLPRTPGAM
jgi:CheY-like chemotaxis protein